MSAYLIDSYLIDSHLIDSHCHLDYLERDGIDIDTVIHDAGEHNVKRMVTIGTNLSRMPMVKNIAHRYDNVYYSAGIHPHEADAHADLNESMLTEYANDTKCVGIGESGLDYYYKKSSPNTQKSLFNLHIDIARNYDMPIIIHTRDAEQDTIAILQQQYAKAPFNAIMHCFTGSEYLAKAALELGFYISLSGIVTFKSAIDLQNTAKIIPHDKLLVETDSPYLAPVPFRGKSNQPAYTYHVAEYLSNLLDMPLDIITNITQQNTLRIFNRMKDI